MRELKRAVKRRGVKHRRAALKKSLRENPEEAPFAEEDFGRFSSETYNGFDQRVE